MALECPPEPMASFRPPTTADYWVGPIIGQGGFAQVHFAQHKESNQKVAIKVIEQTTVCRDPRRLAAILQERNLLAGSLRGMDCVAQLGSSFYDSTCVYMVLELCEGGDLSSSSSFFHDCHASSEERSRWIRSIPSYLSQLRDAIDAIHNLNVIHCDIKPANILLSSHGRVKLTDFGSAWDLSVPDSTFEEGLRGTTEYSSPELIRNHRTEIPMAMDYWSYGCVVSALYTGRTPFYQHGSEALTIQTIFDYVQSQDPDSWLDQASQMGQDGGFQGNVPILNRGLLHPDQGKRKISWLSLSDQKTPIVAENRATASSATAAFDGKSLLPSPKWRETVRDCELQDGAHGWSVFLL